MTENTLAMMMDANWWTIDRMVTGAALLLIFIFMLRAVLKD